MDPLYSLPKALIKATVIARPSKKIKSSYLADINIDGKEYLCHSGALGCSGRIIAGSTVWVLEKTTTTTKSTHEIYLIEEANGTLIGCHPIVANKIAQQYLKTHLSMKDICPEKKINDCRFDFIAKCDDKPTIIEVKTVPIADYYDGTTKEVQEYLKINTTTANNKNNEKIAIFPYCTVAGKRTVSKEPLSELALKHVESLTGLVTTYKCMLLFIIQRNDVSKFCISKLDIQYKEACKKALAAGVIIKAISVRWDNQSVYYEKNLEIVW